MDEEKINLLFEKKLFSVGVALGVYVLVSLITILPITFSEGEFTWQQKLGFGCLYLIISYFFIDKISKYANCEIKNGIFHFKSLLNTVEVPVDDIVAVYFALKESARAQLKITYKMRDKEAFRYVSCGRELLGEDINPVLLVKIYLFSKTNNPTWNTSFD